jgi:hypothetical protein
MVQGTQLSIPLGRYASASEILNVLGGHFSAKA